MSHRRSPLGFAVLLAGGMLTIPPLTSGVFDVPFGWHAIGDLSYVIGADTGIGPGRSGFTVGTIKSIDERPVGTGVMLQSVKADEYLGRRIRLTGYLKAQASEADASLWMRVDGATQVLASDYMEGRPIRGTSDWTKYEIVLDVPRTAVGVSFGIALVGSGQVWADDLSLDVVPRTIGLTGRQFESGAATLRFDRDGRFRSARELYATAPRWPVNLNFEDRTIASR